MSFVSDLFKKGGKQLSFYAGITYVALYFVMLIVGLITGMFSAGMIAVLLVMGGLVALVVFGGKKGNAQFVVYGTLLITGYYALSSFSTVFNMLGSIGSAFDFSALLGIAQIFSLFAAIGLCMIVAGYLAALLGRPLPAIVADLGVLLALGGEVLYFIFYMIFGISESNEYFNYAEEIIYTFFNMLTALCFVVFYASITTHTAQDDAPAAAPAEEKAEEPAAEETTTEAAE